MGKKANKKADTALEAQTQYAKTSADAGTALLKEGAPARQYATDYYKAVAEGKPGELQRAVAPSINSATNQFYLARRQALNMPPGGARDQALRDIGLSEATAKNQIYSGGVGDAVARLSATGLGETSMGLGALSAAGAQQGQVGQTYLAQATQYMQLISDQAKTAGEVAASL